MGIVFSKDNKAVHFYWWQLQVSHSEGSSHLLLKPVPIYAPLWVIIAVWVHALCAAMCLHLHICVCVCACVFTCAGICRRTTVFPTRPPLLLCFVSFSSSNLLQETNTGSLCPLSDLPSVPGDQVGGKMLCRNARPSSGSWASVSSHHWTEVACFSFALVTNKHSVLSPLFFLPFVFLRGTTWRRRLRLSDSVPRYSALVKRSCQCWPHT